MLVVALVALCSAIPTWLIIRKRVDVLRGIVAYFAGFLLGVLLSVLLTNVLEATAFKIGVGMGVVGAFFGPWCGFAFAFAFPSKRRVTTN